MAGNVILGAGEEYRLARCSMRVVSGAPKRFLSGFLAILVALALSGPAQADDGRHLRVNLTPAWTTGIVSDGVGSSDIVLTDLAGDGVTDILACSSYGAFVLNRISGNSYDTVWYSPPVFCSKVAAGDSDGDGVQEIFVGTMDGQVLIFRGDNFRRSSVITLPGRIRVAEESMVSQASQRASNYGDERVTGIGVADVDNDGRKEIVVLGLDATFVYDAQTLVLKWHATGMGGSRLGIGDVDGDGQLEIVVNASPAHILDAARKIEELAYPAGFGTDMAVGDVDGDKISEIVYVTGDGYAIGEISVYEADTRSIKWRAGIAQANLVALGDAERDGVNEVLAGQAQWGSVLAYKGSDGTQLWAIANPEAGVTGIAVGDADNDGINEVIWGAGESNPGLFIGDWSNGSIEWASGDLDGPLSVAAADVDKDGRTEIIMASRSTGSGYFSGSIRVYDGATHVVKWWTLLPSEQGKIHQIAVGQLDEDAALEIVVVAETAPDAASLLVYDGVSHEVEWQSRPMRFINNASQVLVVNLDEDPVEEIVVGLDGFRVKVFHGATGLVQWESDALDGWIEDLAVGDLDGDSVLDMAVLTPNSLYVYEVGTWVQKTRRERFPGSGGQVAIANHDLQGPGELVVALGNDSHWLQVLSGTDFRLLWEGSAGEMVTDIVAVDLDGDGDQEWVLAGPGAIRSRAGPLYLTEYSHAIAWGPSNGVAIADVDNDGQRELIFSSQALIQVNKISTSPLTIPATYLPAVMKGRG